ncbi:hypothetical protein PEBR_07510 [Penicillium brasilianum]|uniref:Uncharacterized protein n=1 Tax=Penicillium brasilianum TaxID=104259 RepID=A0A1S9RVN3_PENBI|nr:hypothetical protein PEBR_07510 [Penicillium brasilianum]
MGGDNTPLVYATKQPVDGSLQIDSKLPYPVIVQDKTDQQHQCNIGAFDNGKREGSCGFTCNNPDQDPKKDPPRTAPANPVKAFEGTGTPQSFGNAKDYTKGSTYALELTLYNNDAALIACTEKTNRAGGDTKNTVNIQGPLQWLITCYSAKDDSTSPTCKYGAQDLTPSHEDSGLRDFGVKFNC